MADRIKTAPELEAEARAVNATNWDPPPGMVKKRCSHCRYFFAVLVAEAEVTSRCPDCAGKGTKVRAPAG